MIKITAHGLINRYVVFNDKRHYITETWFDLIVRLVMNPNVSHDLDMLEDIYWDKGVDIPDTLVTQPAVVVYTLNKILGHKVFKLDRGILFIAQ